MERLRFSGAAIKFKITKGIAELIGYLSIAKNSDSARVDEDKQIILEIMDDDGVLKRVKLPSIIFV